MKVTIDYRFTSMNDYIAAERSHRQRAARIKRDETEIARLSVLDRQPIRKYPVNMIYTWVSKSGRTDPGNIAFAEKFIADGFVKAGILEGDGWKHIKSIHHDFSRGSDDYVTVEIKEADNAKYL